VKVLVVLVLIVVVVAFVVVQGWLFRTYAAKGRDARAARDARQASKPARSVDQPPPRNLKAPIGFVIVLVAVILVVSFRR
jgi:hypothetical protein